LEAVEYGRVTEKTGRETSPSNRAIQKCCLGSRRLCGKRHQQKEANERKQQEKYEVNEFQNESLDDSYLRIEK
jgi:hypothetical protein